MPSIDRLRSKIDAYVQQYETILEEESASKQLRGAFPNEDHSTAGIKVLELLRPLIFVHWTQILHQTPEPAWKQVCTTIASIDNMRRRKAAKNNMTEAVKSVFNPPVVEDADQAADLFLFMDTEEEPDHNVREENRAAMHAWVDGVFADDIPF